MLLLSLSAFTLQSCFQDMDEPPFNYTPDTGEKPYSPIKMELTFEEDIRDKGNYGFMVADHGSVKFLADGVNGYCYQGAKDSYALAKTPSCLQDVIPNIGNLSVAFWMKSTKNTTATGLFTIPNEKTFWGNFDIFLENNSSETQAFFKVHMYNCTASKDNDERWVEARIDDVFGDEWVHMAFVYDGEASTIRIYRNGEEAFSKEISGYGKLKFIDVAPSLAVGAFQFSTQPSLTSGAEAQSWAQNYPGQFDQFRFYDVALTAAEVKQLYDSKE